MGREGCDACGGTGYRGRLALHELLVGSLPVKEAVKKGAGVEQLKALAVQEGMRTLKMDGIQKVFSGLTDFEQIAKVCL
jgi:type II secretory ATPase GspE/PulE/Tfp pilus assembly ATPase PilB-like protein